MLPFHEFDGVERNKDFIRFARETKAVRTARGRYQDIRRESWWRQKLSGLFGHPNHLRELSQVLQKHRIVNYRRLGIQSVEIDRIIGSENRADDFDDKFLPIKDHDEGRWIKIAELMLLNVTLPAVELIKVNGQFYVRDGHHRISVAKNFGQKHIDADVFEWVAAPYDPEPHKTEVEKRLARQAQAC
jgi:hypothetical protein